MSQVSNCLSIAAMRRAFVGRKSSSKRSVLPRLLCHVPLARPFGCVFFFRVPSTRDTFRLFRMAFIVPLVFARQLAPSLPAARFYRVLCCGVGNNKAARARNVSDASSAVNKVIFCVRTRA